jgi:hypothetical protein
VLLFNIFIYFIYIRCTPIIRFIKKIFYIENKFILLCFLDDKWRIHRKILTPTFHFNILHEFLPIFNRNAQKLLECLAAEPKAESKEGFNIFHYSSRCSLDIICGNISQIFIIIISINEKVTNLNNYVYLLYNKNKIQQYRDRIF